VAEDELGDADYQGGVGDETEHDGNGVGVGLKRREFSGKAGKEGPESELCEKGREALARIGRVKRLNLGVREKVGFVNAWNENKRK